MASVEDRLLALESEVCAVKQQIARLSKPRPWLDDVIGSMDAWPEFEEVSRLGREFRQSVTDTSNGNGHGA
jgi:hypothetical protein